MTSVFGRKLKTGVVDFTWPSIQASLQAFNTTSIGQYLLIAYDIVHVKCSPKYIKQLTTLYMCSSHVRRSFSESIEDEGLLDFVMSIFARLQDVHTMQIACSIYESMCIVYTSTTLTPNVSKHVTKLVLLVDSSVVNEETQSEDIDDQVENERNDGVLGLFCAHCLG